VRGPSSVRTVGLACSEHLRPSSALPRQQDQPVPSESPRNRNSSTTLPRDELLFMIRYRRSLDVTSPLEVQSFQSECFCRNEQEREVELSVSNTYMSRPGSEVAGQDFITPQMRMIVTSWLSEVAAEFRLQQETLFLSVALMDRFLSVSGVRTAVD
jgi:hypothetical protein